MEEYISRVVDSELDALIEELPAISLEGPKGVGKTATAQRRAHSTFALDDDRTRQLLLADLSRLDGSASPVLVDEWQREPSVWDAVRRSVDRNARAGRFILTGSATPTTAPTHSGAGRIVRLRMRPMSLVERGHIASVSLAGLLGGHVGSISGTSELTLTGYADEVVRSGLPAVRQLGVRGRRVQLDSYLDRVVEHDFAEQGLLVRRPATLRAWLAAYAAATATAASYNTILDAAMPGDSDKPAKETTLAYRDVLTQLWLLDPVPAWIPGRNAFSRLAATPKHHLADPAFAARLLGAEVSSLLDDSVGGPPVPRDGVLLGSLFESLVTLSVRVYAQAAEATVHHLRTRNGDHEVDLIVRRADGRVVALEVKLSGSVEDRDTVHLRWLRDRLGPDLLDAAVITTGPEAYRRRDGVAVIPAALLGP